MSSRALGGPQERLALLVRAGELFHRSLDVDETLDTIARFAVEQFADLCLFDLIDERSDRLYVTAAAHRDPSIGAALKDLGLSILQRDAARPHPAVRVSRTGTSHFVPQMNESTFDEHAVSEEHAAFMRRMAYRSKIVVPVGAQGRIFGALTFVRTGDAEPFDARDVEVAEEIGRRAGLAVANAKQFYREQQVAATLQRSILSQAFPLPPWATFSAFYRPATHDNELGGDWYDAFEAPDGSVVLTIGDVAGKGIDAARLMVQLRASVRVAATLSVQPAGIMGVVNHVLLAERPDALATAFVGVVEPNGRRLSYTSAGHPPALLRRGDGTIVPLSVVAPPLGVSYDTVFEERRISVDGDALLLLYTDGLTEIARDRITGEERLRRLLESEAAMFAANPARFVERAVGRDARRDDIAVLTCRFSDAPDAWRVDIGDSGAAYAIKRELIDYLAALPAVEPDDVYAAELIVSELIGNAVRHAPGALSMAVAVQDDDVVLHLIDEGPGFDYDPNLPHDVWSESGRGLFLVATMARSVAVTRLPGYGSYTRVALAVGTNANRAA